MSSQFEANPLASLGKNSLLNVEQARKLARAISGELSSGRNPFEEHKPTPVKDELTVEELFELYMRDHVDGKRKTGAAMRAGFNLNCVELAPMRLSEVTVEIAQEYHRSFKNRTYVGNRTVQMLRAMWNRAIAWQKYDGTNPWRAVTLFPEKARNFALMPNEVERLWNVVEKEFNPMIRDFVRLALLTGARKTELCRMRWDCVNFDVGTWLIADGKTGSRIVVLGQYEIDILNQRRQLVTGDWVFPGETAEGHLLFPYKAWERVKQAANLPNCNIHDLRRSHASAMVSVGADPKTVQAALGHADLKTTFKHYVVAFEPAQRAAKKAVAAAWFGQNKDKELSS